MNTISRFIQRQEIILILVYLCYYFLNSLYPLYKVYCVFRNEDKVQTKFYIEIKWITIPIF